MISKRIKQFFLGCCLLPGAAAWAQQPASTVTGTVITEKGELLQGVTVKAERKAGMDAAPVQGLTDEKGIFVFRQLAVGGSYDFNFSFVGYQTYVLKDFKVTAGKNSSILIKLRDSDSRLD